MKKMGYIIAILTGITLVGCRKNDSPTSQRDSEAKTADMSKYVSADGITIPRDDHGAPGGSGVYFTTVPGDEEAVTLKGQSILAVLRFTGTMECTGDGRLGGGTDKFKPTRMQMSKNSDDKWYAISSFSIANDGLLVVIDETGTSYKIKLPMVLSQSSGTIEQLGKNTQ